MENQFHIAVVQAEQQMYDCNKNIQRGLEFIKQAKEMGADLVLKDMVCHYFMKKRH